MVPPEKGTAMTHVLPISAPAGSRGLSPLQMQFAAPLRTAEAYGLEADPQAGPQADRHGGRAWPLGAALALPLLALIWAGVFFWGQA